MDNPVPQRTFEYRGSVITIEQTAVGEQLSVGADVHTDGKLIGRLALTAGEGHGDCLGALIEKLGRKAKELVDRAKAELSYAGQEPAPLPKVAGPEPELESARLK